MIGPVNDRNSYGLAIMLSADLKKLDMGLKEANKAINEMNENMVRESRKSSNEMDSILGGSFKKIASYAAAAFSVQAIANFGREAVEMASKLEGVETAFNRLNRPDLLNNLRAATRGTVSDLELMRQAVRADNFQVPLEKLASFFDFATKRSAQTGESVDYLVNSIIDGIGRKSTLVLDNLGISAARLQEEVKKTGDFGAAAGKIIEEELGKAGNVGTTSAQKISALNTAFTNLQTTLGEVMLGNEGGLLGALTNALNGINQSIQLGTLFDARELDLYNAGYRELIDGGIRGFKKLEKGSEEYENKLIKLRAMVDEAKKATEEYEQRADKKGRILAMLMAKMNGYRDLLKIITKENKEAAEAEKNKGLSIEEATKKQEEAIAEYERMVASGLFSSGPIVGPNVDFLEIPDEMAQMADEFESAQDAIEDLTVESKKFFANQAEGARQLANMGNVIGTSFSDAFASIIDGTATIDEALKRLLADLTAALIRMLIIRGIMAAFSGGASEATGIASAASGAIARGIGVGSFADGGIISGPTLGLVGEYSGARTNPEVIAPLDKLKSLLSSSDMGMSASVRVSGEDLIIMLQKAQGRLERKRGF